MGTATPWTEQSVNPALWTEGVTALGFQYRLFGAIVLYERPFSDPGAASWTEASVAATSFTEKNQTSTTWVEY